mmetsp:Transcript_29842/g.65998  ORF Transcript_29842/g.65998 Transcript_29842/m.65998 type:complete len:724 (-) Transcript_29842:358-2529(-)|eukprot:CAMPEP_0202893512 /NCGR_PEP_ID=MMETSP1392-20130828/3083_1 /ASSEMBLY_ACC=CAM_ASM_000868 /TAXON_ID=225041 /ORGANISM="Chlamydomonas chlamydogama, Strain SAG 11-48b" /LENGTH=723 /DNA_ID=CAMNT_0049577873 /DNA_START=428 /DNA_END=2599 /DNA_ORIENTATION=-
MVAWFVGAAINVVGSIAINLGTNVMKLGHNKREMVDLPEEKKPSIVKFKEWQIGVSIFIIGNIANFASFAFAAQSLLAALGSVQFVSNVIFASFVLKEKITFMVLMATACIIGGCLVLVLFGNHSSDTYTVDELLDLYRKPAYIVYLVMMFVFVFGSYIVYLHGKRVGQKPGKENSFFVQLLPVAYSIFSALLGTQSVLFSKSLSVLLRETISGTNQLGNWYTWVTLICFLISAGFWVTRLNKGLRMFPALIIVPLMQIAWTLFSIISGMIYFEEYKTFTTLSACMFALGVTIVFLGVYLLTRNGQKQLKKGYEQMEDASEQKVEMTNNPAFEPQNDPPTSNDPDVPKKKDLLLDTLRFTSLPTATGATVKELNKMQRSRGLGSTIQSRDTVSLGGNNLNATMDTVAESEFNSTYASGTVRNSALQHHHDSNMNGTRASQDVSVDEQSMMGTIRKKMRTIHKRMKSDFGIIDTEGVKQTFGLGTGNMPALSLFAMPTLDFQASGGKAPHGSGGSKYSVNGDILSALPQSRFYTDDEETGQQRGNRLDPIKETPSMVSSDLEEVGLLSTNSVPLPDESDGGSVVAPRNATSLNSTPRQSFTISRSRMGAAGPATASKAGVSPSSSSAALQVAAASASVGSGPLASEGSPPLGTSPESSKLRNVFNKAMSQVDDALNNTVAMLKGSGTAKQQGYETLEGELSNESSRLLPRAKTLERPLYSSDHV